MGTKAGSPATQIRSSRARLIIDSLSEADSGEREAARDYGKAPLSGTQWGAPGFELHCLGWSAAGRIGRRGSLACAQLREGFVDIVASVQLAGTTKDVRGALAFGDAAQAASVKLPRAGSGPGHRVGRGAGQICGGGGVGDNAEILQAYESTGLANRHRPLPCSGCIVVI
jgi:hypothetical protein